MSYQADVYLVFIASPGDVSKERQLAREIIYEWNSINSSDKKICLLPVVWEQDSSPEMGSRGQEIINKQILEKSDLLIGIFWTRIGTPTGDSISGTVEEIGKHINSGKPTKLYFSNTPIPPYNIDQEQLRELQKFKEDCQKKGLLGEFDSLDDLRNKLTRQLSQTIINNDYFKKNINDNQNFADINKTDEIESLSLSEEEEEIILESAKDPKGSVMALAYMAGFSVETNGKRLNKDFESRTRAIWRAAIKNLVSKNILEEQGFTGEMFSLTLFGYKIAEKLQEK